MRQPTLQETRQLELTVPPDMLFAIEAGSGSLSVQGEAGLEMIMVEAEIWHVSANENYTLTLQADGDERARLVSEAASGFGGNNDRIDLSIRVPSSLALRITDGSGSIRVRNLAGKVDIEDGSGSIDITRVGGDVTLDDGSGSISIDNVDGSIRIDDGSGSITVASTGGDVRIDDDSGSITVRNTGGKVAVSDASGSITVDGAGDFELLEDG
ncbi:MAG: hypothetical protein ACNS61_16755, partial [Candidatus Wenzhouxiangella sp. M2_3B_020]